MSLIKFSLVISFLLIFISCDKESEKTEINQIPNIDFKGLDNLNYNFINYSNNDKDLLLFGFATWCGYSRRQLPIILKVDSFLSDKVVIVGLDCSNVDDTVNINGFIKRYNIRFPVTKIFWNKKIDALLFPDSVYSFPRLLLISRRFGKVYSQVGFDNSSYDSILYYVK